MTIRFHDSYRGEKVDFAPADPGRVTVYCCGPTVYAEPHIGNLRAGLAADLAVRLLRAVYGEDAVVYARNLTDIDDKIMAAAREGGEAIGAVTDRATEAYHRDMAAIGCAPPDHEPRATRHIGEMQALVTTLLAGGHAYAAEGHVLFSVASFPGYGRLSKLDQDAIQAGARVEVAPYKRDPSDFVLWKPSAADEPGWDAPGAWGLGDGARGRPGWHLECSAMIEAVLGAPIDLHMGGQDLRFPHHENEVAQSCCAADLGGVPLARVWLHNGMLRLGDGKMSKSLGNVIRPSEILSRWPGEVVRYGLLSAQYRQPLEWSDELLASAKAQLDRFYRVIGEAEGDGEVPASVLDALKDDLNTPAAFAALHALREAAGRGETGAAASLLAGGRLLGLFGAEPEAWFKGDASDDDARIDALLVERAEARKARDFARADAIRDELSSEGIVIEDGPNGATWRRG
ncbi:cysteine--tRNA ligase [Parvularcula dongshanensis]|uniref:Cysteine--tRNA ligase n=1 Tax=Parvularcula dongshanensis TaxID=1173995 RepID=A0A840HYK6_9PROT|nr:cysteine--tRNA ligase [Parvularcula dongshanensis]MBB4657659.1 cysteinyl-tRNA synthetase [Parvularcula dongshanensis]